MKGFKRFVLMKIGRLGRLRRWRLTRRGQGIVTHYDLTTNTVSLDGGTDSIPVCGLDITACLEAPFASERPEGG